METKLIRPKALMTLGLAALLLFRATKMYSTVREVMCVRKSDREKNVPIKSLGNIIKINTISK